MEDIHGNPVSLASLKGKTVLLDFWTTWCPPCRADAPSFEKLYEKYGGKNLMIIGISVSEDRKIVEDYLKKNAHSYPVVLTSENEMPRTYQLGVFPTYIVISPMGRLPPLCRAIKDSENCGASSRKPRWTRTRAREYL